MKFFKFFIAFAISCGLFYLLNNRLQLESVSIPPLGKFLNPYEGFWQNAESKAIDGPANISLEGLEKEVIIRYDSNLIPHIFAENEKDLYMASGYVAAYHRLWQLELVTHNAAGRLSEIIGKRTINIDREQKRIGMLWSAQKVLNEWKKNPQIMEMLNSYSNGVNSYIQSLSYKDYPIEYKILNYAPEKWEPLKSALVLKYMSKMLTIGEDDIENTNFVKKYGLELFNQIYPDFPEGIDPIIPEEKIWDFTPSFRETETDTSYVFVPIAKTISKQYPGVGSNNWAVGSTKTKSGNAYFSNDMHLNMSLPAIWFVVQYHTPEFNVYGHILPGTPMIIQGFNDSIAWGMTNAKRDIVDWYQIELKNKYRNEYLYDGTWLLTKKIVDTIKVRDAEDIIDTIVHTHHGPIVYDKNFLAENPKVNLAMRWLAHDVSYEPLCFTQLAKAHNYEDFKKAIRHFSCPPQNLAFADIKGNVAIHVQGKFPVKYPNQGKFIMDGSTSKTEWPGYISPEHNPQIFNPTRGFVSSANQHPVDSTYPYYVYSDNNEYYRNRRINTVLNEKESMVEDDLMNLQNDNYSIFAEELLPVLLDSLDKSNLSENDRNILSVLESWNYEYNPLLAAPAYFEIWSGEFYKLIWDEISRSDIPLPYPSSYQTVWLIKNEPDFEFFDIDSTEQKETINDLINLSFKETIYSISDWQEENEGEQLTRASYFHTDVMHYTRIPQFSAMDLEVGGSGDAVNANTYRHGPSERIIIEMGNPIKAWHTYPGGQSGNPGNPHYKHFLASWVNGEYFPVFYYHEPSDHEEATIFSQTLNPQ